jgi:hypothetical protein
MSLFGALKNAIFGDESQPTTGLATAPAGNAEVCGTGGKVPESLRH